MHHTIVELARRHHEEDLDIVGVPTSLATHALATDLGLPLVELDDVQGLDLVIDGADEVDAAFQLIKGGGPHSCVRNSWRKPRAMVVVADDRKMVETLGAFPLPIEITRFGHGTTVRAIMDVLGCTAELRMDGEAPLVTDNGNFIVDAHTGPHLTDPADSEAALLRLAGVVQVGLFIDMCDVVHLAGASGAERLVRSGGRLA